MSDFYEMITHFSDTDGQRPLDTTDGQMPLDTTDDDAFNLQWDENAIAKSPIVDMPDNDDKLLELLTKGV